MNRQDAKAAKRMDEMPFLVLLASWRFNQIEGKTI